MDQERDLADSRRLASLAEKFHDKRYRDGYVAAHTRGVLARQMRNFRGELSQQEFAAQIGKQKTVIARLENSAYGGWSLRTMLEIARKRDVAAFVRFVDFPTFLKYSGDLSPDALLPTPYDQNVIDEPAHQDQQQSEEMALKALFSPPPKITRPGALDAMQRMAIEPPKLTDAAVNDNRVEKPPLRASALSSLVESAP